MSLKYVSLSPTIFHNLEFATISTLKTKTHEIENAISLGKFSGKNSRNGKL